MLPSSAIHSNGCCNFSLETTGRDLNKKEIVYTTNLAEYYPSSPLQENSNDSRSNSRDLLRVTSEIDVSFIRTDYFSRGGIHPFATLRSHQNSRGEMCERM